MGKLVYPPIALKRIRGSSVAPEIKNFCPLNCFILSTLFFPLCLSVFSPHFISSHCYKGRRATALLRDPTAKDTIFPTLLEFMGLRRQPGVTLLRVKPSWPKSATMWSTAGGGWVAGLQWALNYLIMLRLVGGGGEGWSGDLMPLSSVFSILKARGDSPRLSITTTGAEKPARCVRRQRIVTAAAQPTVTRHSGGSEGA